MRVSKSYESWNYDEAKAFEKNGKLYVKASTKCDHCIKGIFPCRVENGKPVPHPNDGGICYQCGGTGIVKKDIRLYTEEEFEKKEAAAARAKARKQAAREAQIKAEYENNRIESLSENGFNVDTLSTFVYYPENSYDVKEKLKEDGFKFSTNLLWHIAEVPEGYEDKVVEVKFDDVAEMSAWGKISFLTKARDVVNAAILAQLPPVESEWIAEPGDRIRDIPVILTAVRGFEGYYGYSQIVRFEDESKNILKWFTTVDLFDYEIGDKLLLTATVKDHIEDKYERNAHVSIVSRAKLEVA